MIYEVGSVNDNEALPPLKVNGHTLIGYLIRCANNITFHPTTPQGQTPAPGQLHPPDTWHPIPDDPTRSFTPVWTPGPSQP